MCNNSLIYLTTPTVANVAADGELPFTTIVRRRGNSIKQFNNSIVLGAPGYYKVYVTTTFTAPAAGDVTITLLQNGNAVQGATASTTITTATTEIETLSVEAIVRVNCNGSPNVITVLNDGVEINTSNIAISVEYLN